MRPLRTLLAAITSLALGASIQAPVTFAAATATPIQHVVVIFQENVSFDHYFGTYPNAANLAGEPAFSALPNTPAVNGLTTALLTQNPNLNNPHRLSRAQAATCDMDHDYLPEQKAVDGGKMDKFVENTTGKNCGSVTVMDYYDGNTVTALWNYAQHFALNDNSYNTTFGPSTPGVLNLVSGQTHGATPTDLTDVTANGSDIGDADPTYDDCSAGKTIAMSGKNVGDLLNAQNITWGWFQGGFRPTGTKDGKPLCGAVTASLATALTDYSAHHEPFQYYQSTANPHHLPPSSVTMIGKTDQANHQYDLSDFWAAADAGNLPAVSFLKAPRAQDGHAGYSTPLDEQAFLVETINHLEKLPTWNSTAVIINWDDSDGWYDHQAPPQVSPSNDATYDSACGTPAAGAYLDRCGYGPRLPLLVVSPYAKANFVDHTRTDQSSILRFIEDNWQLGRIGDQSMDAAAGTLNNMFDFSAAKNGALTLYPDTGLAAASLGEIGGAGAFPSGQPISGSLAGSSGGSFQTYSFVGDGSVSTISFSYMPASSISDKGVGVAVYGQGFAGGAKSASSGAVTYTVPTVSGTAYTVKVFDYIPASNIQYTISRS